MPQSSSGRFGEERGIKALSGLKPRADQTLAHVDSDARTISVLDLWWYHVGVTNYVVEYRRNSLILYNKVFPTSLVDLLLVTGRAQLARV